MSPQLEARAQYDTTSPYGYVPSAWIGILFLIIFILSTVAHSGQVVYYRLWWLFPTVCLAGIMEITGWAGRTWSHYNVLLNTPYIMQILLTILAPTPLVAANFIMLGQVIRRLGGAYSRLSARWYTRIFLGCDIIALFIQGGGGGIASGAASSGSSSGAKLGSDIMLGGIIFQLIAITFYMLLGAEFILRYLYKRPIRGRAMMKTQYIFDRNIKTMIAALTFSSLCIYVRSWYRTIELANGWEGYIIHTQRYFVIMDALMIAFAMTAMNICHPGRLLGPARVWENKDYVPTNIATETTEGQTWMVENDKYNSTPVL